MSASEGFEADPALAVALVSGGDDRLAIDPRTGMNGYGCTPLPRPGEISMSSTTASTISLHAHTAAASAFALLRPGAAGAAHRHADAMDEIRAGLGRSFGWTKEEIVLSPSGTDSELLLIYLVRQLLDGPLSCIVVSSDETGSGVALAASGRHFAETASSGERVGKGDPTGGPTASLVHVPTRGEDGELVAAEAIDALVLEKIAAEIRSGHDVLLHVMHHSKTGASGPSKQCLAHIRAQYPTRVRVAVDACQARVSRGELREWLDAECILILTGSKFFTGPPLSGAIVLPAALAARLRRSPIAAGGLAAYSTPCDWPLGWTLRSELPERVNTGQLLRWTAALSEIERYFAVPLAFRESALSCFEQAVHASFMRHECVNLLDAAPARSEHDATLRDEFRYRSVFALTVRHRGGLLGEADSRLLHRALNAAVCDLGSEPAASRYCHIGQPVVIKGATKAVGALRISSDARLAADCWSGRPDSTDRLRERCMMVETVLEKISFLVGHFDRLQRFG
jgi:hypothetical protein